MPLKKIAHFLKNHSPTRELLKNWAIFVRSKMDISLNISIDCSQSTCMYQFTAGRGHHDFGLGLALVELVKNTWWSWTIITHFYHLAKFTKRLRQVQQVQALNKIYGDFCSPLIFVCKLAVTRQYLYLVRYKFSCRKNRSHFLGVILRPGWNHPYINLHFFCYLLN